ncbi:extracellular solute-binding protein [Salarchaeum sp. JOR-1]|uniref:extracellular solute-binding protein n=1 Tax=Salarchaeum sp. JOR-1 TaxID=2599399 RepID=UPI0011985ED8|nr:extracellular solute-binding protein [Salarchaeum sp. JOR-1]QDX40634.1 extracellular solute-binding protein [Salarchaeum sp. JOR-1]
MRRRALLTSLASGALAGLAGCANSSTPREALTAGATREFVASSPDAEVAGTWLAEEFRARTTATLSWETPPGALSAYVARHLQGAAVDADAFLGVTPGALATARERTDGLFTAASGYGQVIDAYEFDPEARVLPVTRSDVCLVYDETRVAPPTSFAEFFAPGRAPLTLVPDPRTDALGLAFFAWSIHEFGLREACERWREFLDAGAHLVASSADARTAYRNGLGGVLVGTSTTPLFAARDRLDLERYRVQFLDGDAYRHVVGVGRFADAANAKHVDRFTRFLLEPNVQGRIAVLTGSLPVIEDAALPEDFDRYVRTPDATVSPDYGSLAASLGDWLAAWQRTVTAARA